MKHRMLWTTVTVGSLLALGCGPETVDPGAGVLAGTSKQPPVQSPPSQEPPKQEPPQQGPGVQQPGKDVCVRSADFWMSNPSLWRLDAVLIGDESHSREELIALSGNDDASVILAREMVSAQLNLIATGRSPAEVNDALRDSQAWMVAHANASGKLPFNVPASSSAGAEGRQLAARLAAFNRSMAGNVACEGKAEQQPPKQEPAAQQQPPKQEPPAQQQPPKQEPPKQEPATQEPPKQEPTTQEPPKQEPATQQPPKQEPTTQEPPKQEPTTQEPPKQEPVTQEPVTQETQEPPPQPAGTPATVPVMSTSAP